MTEVPRVLVLAGASPAEQHGGEVYLAEACRHYPPGRLSRFAVAQPQYARPAEWLGIPIQYADHPREMGVTRLGTAVARASAFAVHLHNRRSAVPRLVDEAARFGRSQEPDILWALLDSPTLMAVAHRTAHALGVPLVVSVLDPPERWIVDLRLDAYSSRVMLRDFETSLRAAERVAVISEGMAAEYRDRYGLKTILLRHGVHPALVRSPAAGVRDGDDLVIGLAGSLYGHEARATLFDALDRSGWRIAGRRVRLRILSNAFNAQVAGHADIEFLGWRSLAETIDLLADCDVLYLPYWFDPRYAYTARMCFPTKLASYLASGRPVLVHAPAASAPAAFLGRYPAGLVCDEPSVAGLMAGFERLVTDRDFYRTATEAGRHALQQELGLEVFLARVSALIGGGERLAGALLREAGLDSAAAVPGRAALSSAVQGRPSGYAR